MASLELAIQHAEQALRDAAHGQHDLLGSLATQAQTIQYKIVPVWNEHDRLFGEKETLGLYLSGHPIHRYLNELLHFTADRICELRPTGKNQTATVAGIITGIRIIQTKRGDRMAVITIDDSTSQIDVLCFSDSYHQYREYLVKDKLIVVEGEISLDEFSGNNRVICRELFSIDQARERYAKYLKIQLPENKSEDIGKLAHILEKHRGGNCRIAIDYLSEGAKANLHLGERWRVRPTDDLIQTLKEMTAENSVEMVY
jgi:DNA polymerase-3 subunit alpha